MEGQHRDNTIVDDSSLVVVVVFIIVMFPHFWIFGLLFWKAGVYEVSRELYKSTLEDFLSR